MKTRPALVLAALAIASLAACGSSPDTAAPVSPTEQVEVTSQQIVVVPGPADPAQPPGELPTSAAAAPVLVAMPNVVCMNLQAAQNTIQAAGVFFSRSEDATGGSRSQINDSNWVVVSQTPAPGELVGEGDAVLSAVKLTEPSNC